jgi:DNA-binding HxlR family transcriptional regulator
MRRKRSITELIFEFITESLLALERQGFVERKVGEDGQIASWDLTEPGRAEIERLPVDPLN